MIFNCKSQSKDRRGTKGRMRCWETIQFFQWHALPCHVSLLTLLLNPCCKNAQWTIYLTGWVISDCYTWNWRKSKQKCQLGYCQGTVWTRCSMKSGASPGQAGQEVVRMERTCSAHPSTTIRLLTAYCCAEHWQHKGEKSLPTFLFVYLGTMSLALNSKKMTDVGHCALFNSKGQFTLHVMDVLQLLVFKL